MGKGRPRAVEKGVLGHGSAASSSSSSAAAGLLAGVPQAPVFHPTEEEFRDPLEYIYKIRPEAEPFGICRIVPPGSWKPPFALDPGSFSFPTKSQDIHRLQARPPSCDSSTFDLEYSRFLEAHLGCRPRRRRPPVFEGEDLDLCGLFNAVKRFGGYDKACRDKHWGDVARFLRPGARISECSKHVLSQLYREHLYDYEEHLTQLNLGTDKRRKNPGQPIAPYQKRRKNPEGEKAKEVTTKELDQICQQCKSGLHGDVMLLCDRCDKGWHLYCLSPPLESIPPGNWYCLECVSDKDSFGFVPGKRCSLEGFRRIDDRAKKKWLGQSRTTRSQIEKRFWEIVEGRAGEVEVKYGSELDTSVYGSGFPRAGDPIPSSVDPDVWSEYCSSPWNLNNLPKLQGSLLRVVHDNITGVMVPWLYVGMLFSSFCWHVEDHCFYSINYLHWGEPKCWYGVPGTEANAFEKVMRNTLPDLFDAQPDLLFQLVTMLSPSVLRENGVPVYGALQEPGNFVITFPKSFHGGFNFGLNCAEAVNFASADWLPHGGFGAELYRLYRKAAVLSHEELLCVVAKNGCDSKVLPYLKEEMHRIFVREKRCREELWRKGTVRSSPMSSKKHPTHVGTEEDPTCVICQQYLYLSAITCSCRPSAFVCLEHWKHLCECNPYKRRLLYRQTLADLCDLAHMGSPKSGATCNAENRQNRNSQRHLLHPDESSTVTKKVKFDHITYSQLAEEWLSNACHIFERPFSNVAFTSALKEAEQFLWADHEMDPVRDMAKKLIEAQKWAMNVRDCLSKVDSCLHCPNNHGEKLSLYEVEELLSFDPLPCYEPGHVKLKAYVEDARVLVVEIRSALSSRLDIDELEKLHSRAIKFPINLEESGMLTKEISSAKVLINYAWECLSEKKPSAIDVDVLNKIKLEMLELRVLLPEMDLLLNFCREVESWQVQCKEMLAGPLKLKELEVFLKAADNITVSIPELKLLRQHLCDARSWISHLHCILQTLKDREDHENIVAELSCILKAGELLRVQVDELPVVETELRRSRCREKALKALDTRMPMELIRQLLAEASLLEIANEKLFLKISGVLQAATSWEERAQFILSYAAQMSEFEDVARTSENIFAILPSLPDVMDAISMAQSWISRSKPYLLSSICDGDALGPLLKVDDLKELVAQSKLLKVTLDGLPERLERNLKNVDDWELSTRPLVEHSMSLLHIHDTDLKIDNQLSLIFEDLLKKIDSSIAIGLSLGFEFNELPKLQDASLTLQCCFKALSFCFRIPLIKEVDDLLEEMDPLPVTFSGSNLVQVLTRGARWLRKAFIIVPESLSTKRCKLKDVEEILNEIQEIVVPYPVMVGCLQNAIKKHESWIDQMHVFFRMPADQSWSLLMKLKERGHSDAFDCPELHKVASEIEKVEKWMAECRAIVGPIVGGLDSLFDELVKIKGTIERALCIYHSSRGYRTSKYCVCCPNDSENEEVYTCLTCEDRYHFSCMGPPLATAGMTNEYACPFCLCMESGTILRVGGRTLISKGNRPEIKSFVELLSISENFYAGVVERGLLQEIVKQASECRTYLMEILNHAFSFCGKDLASVSESLLRALKATAVAAVYDHQDSCHLEAALSRNSWKIRVKKLLRGSKRPAIQQVQRLLKEGLVIGVPSEDHFMCEIAEVKKISLQWVETAKMVALDSGALELSEVFKLIGVGETLPVHFEKEMKSLRERSVLYCICRKPYDQRAMIACDQCDEWYHFDCINLYEPPPKTFFCPACKPVNGEFISLPHVINNEERLSTDEEPCTPPTCHNEAKIRFSRKFRSSVQQKMQGTVDLSNVLKFYSEMDRLWRESRKPLQRTARKRSNLESLSRIFDSQHAND